MRALVAMHQRAQGRRGVVAGTGVFDLDDVRAQVGQVQRAHRAGQQPREVEHATPASGAVVREVVMEAVVVVLPSQSRKRGDGARWPIA